MDTRNHRWIPHGYYEASIDTVPATFIFYFYNPILFYRVFVWKRFIRNKIAYKYVCRLYLIVRRVYKCVNINLYVIYFLILCIFQNKKKGTCSFNIYNIYLENKMYFNCTRFFRVIDNVPNGSYISPIDTTRVLKTIAWYHMNTRNHRLLLHEC